jgi:hypothetical protein
MEIEHKHSYKLDMEQFHMLTIKNIAIVWNFEVMSDKYKIGYFKYVLM